METLTYNWKSAFCIESLQQEVCISWSDKYQYSLYILDVAGNIQLSNVTRTSVILEKGEKAYFLGMNEGLQLRDGISSSSSAGYFMVTTTNSTADNHAIKVSGMVESLIYKTDEEHFRTTDFNSGENITDLSYLFASNLGLYRADEMEFPVFAPDNILKDDECMFGNGMFYGCDFLTRAPKIHGFLSSIYNFHNCYNLQHIDGEITYFNPDFSIKIWQGDGNKSNCNEFENCVSLTSVPKIYFQNQGDWDNLLHGAHNLRSYCVNFNGANYQRAVSKLWCNLPFHRTIFSSRSFLDKYQPDKKAPDCIYNLYNEYVSSVDKPSITYSRKGYLAKVGVKKGLLEVNKTVDETGKRVNDNKYVLGNTEKVNFCDEFIEY